MTDQEFAALRPELQALYEREKYLWDDNRPAATAKIHARGQRTARENIADLCDAGSFHEYGALAVAARRTVMEPEALMELSPADGVILGTATVNGAQFGPDGGRCAVMAYDQSVLAGTQGLTGHRKTDRLFALAIQHNLPLVIFAGGGGGRPGDVDADLYHSAALCLPTWARLGRLSGRVPTVAILSRYCFAGNAAIAGCCDAIIATQGSNSGMGGPAMIEGGGMGVVDATEVGPAPRQAQNGVIDILVEDDAAAVAAAKRYLAYFQGPLPSWQAADQSLLRTALPERSRRSYDVMKIIELLADTGSVQELRRDFAVNMVTCLARFEGRTVGIAANNTRHYAGAIDSAAADKLARFMQLCNVHRIPMVNLVDCPGFMVGVQAEEQALVRHANRLYIVAAHMVVPRVSIFLRAAYGLGAIAMGFGEFTANTVLAAWPTARFGPMGDEGAVRLGYKKQLDAAATAEERAALFDALMAERQAQSNALHAASTLEVDAVIDPAATRDWIIHALHSAGPMPPKNTSGECFVDAW